MTRLFLAAVVAGWALGAYLLFVRHDGDVPVRADAVVVLAGADERLPVGLDLVRRGYAPILLVSRNHDPSPLEQHVCTGAAAVIAVCESADPYSTRGEAELIARVAEERGWRTVDVVTSRFHVLRAKRMIERCWQGRVVVVAAPNPGWPRFGWGLVTESVKLVYHEVDRRC